MDVDEASRRLSGVQISSSALKEKQNNSGEGEDVLSEEDQARFIKYIQRAKKLVEEGNVEAALHYNKKALKICHKEKLARKVKKMEDYLKANAEESSDDNSGMVHVGDGFYLYHELFQKLYAHQKEGVLWMWSLFKKKKGGILGDDMGLGKTIQVIGFLSGLFDMGKIKSVLIVLPVAVMVNWENEFNKWAPGLKVEAFHGNSKREKERALAKVQRRGGICLTTYGLVVTSWEQLGQKDGVEFTWDYMILDEGHKIKNPTKTSKGVHAIPARNRIILTGTPVQNNLKELWALFDFVHQGSLLGTQRTFKMEYENPITRAREKDATVGEKRLGMVMAESLKKIIAPYFLRRTKAEVKNTEDKENTDPEKEISAKMPTMTRKNDLIVWLFMSETQLKIYKDFLELDSVKELLMTKKSPLVALTVLKKICDHPRLLSTKACAQLGVDGDEGLDDELLETEEAEMSAATRIQHVADEVLIRESGKLMFLIKLLDQLKVDGHRCLVFSQSRKILDIMQKVLTNKGHKVMRLDGSISQVYEREQRINKFQTDNSYSVFLLTTQVGGVGLTLTAADRVVIFDPSWNPATDAQAVDRAFRIGQDKNVVIYRLITCGTVEEKIYRRQIFKDSITRQTTGNAKNPYRLITHLSEDHIFDYPKVIFKNTLGHSQRYFSKYELRELFTLDDPHSSTTQQQLEQMHSGHRLTDPSLDSHIAFLYSLDMFGLSDHDLMFSQGASGGDDQDVEDDSACPENDYIQHRVDKARQLIQMESSQPITLEERHGKMPRSDSGSQGSRNQFDNWDIPRAPGGLDRESDEIPGPRKLFPEAQENSEEIDLTTTPQKHVSMTAEDDDVIDLSSGGEVDVEPIVKTEKSDDVFPYLDSGDIKKEDLKKEYDVPSSLIMKEDKHELGDDVVMNSPKPLQAKSDAGHDLNMSVDEHNQHNLKVSDTEHMNMSVDEASMHKVLTPLSKKTPKSVHTPQTPLQNSDRVIAEEMLISPDSSRPIITTEAKQSISGFSAVRNLVSRQDHSSKLNSTILSNLIDTPDTDTSTKSSVSSTGSNSPERVPKMLTEDSPIARDNRSKLSKRLVIQDLPEKSESEEEDKSLNQSIKLDASVLVDSVLEESMEQDSEEKFSTTGKRYSISKSHRNTGLEKISNVNEHENDNSLPDINTDTEAKSELQDEDEDMLPVLDNPVQLKSVEDSNLLPDLDSPVLPRSMNKAKPSKKYVMESSDENSDNEKLDEKTVNDTNDFSDTLDRGEKTDSSAEVDDIGNKEIVNGFIEDKADTDEEHEDGSDVENGDSSEEETEYSGEEESSEEETDADEEEGLQDFHSLSPDKQEEYNSLVEMGRTHCRQKEFEMAQVCVLQALDIYPDPELQTKAQQIYKKILKYQALREQGMI